MVSTPSRKNAGKSSGNAATAARAMLW